MIGAIIEDALRKERVGIVASLLRVHPDLELVEDAIQDASLRALSRWPVDGVPDKPSAWLAVVARHALIDRLRQDAVRSRPDMVRAAATATSDEPSDVGERQATLDLLFCVCATELAQRTRVCLALRTLVGLSTRQIARAFLEDERTTAQRLVRGKRALRRMSEPAAPPVGEARQVAIEAVLETLYLLFNEGYLAAEGETLLRERVMLDALELCVTACDALPYHAEAMGLVALFHFHAARHDARVDEAGRLVPLEEQDRSRWDWAMIAAGVRWLDRAIQLHRGGQPQTGQYQIQAAIASLHCHAESPEMTNWLGIAALYRRLLDFVPTAVVELNAAIALGMTGDLDHALRWVNNLEKRGTLQDYHLLLAAKADLLRRLGHDVQARRYYVKARTRARNEGERDYLSRRIAELDDR